MTNVILCGGSGTRLWPISRKLLPKQFVKLFDDKSLFKLTLKRNSRFCDEILIVSNEEQYFLASDQREEILQGGAKKVRFLLEPIGRNTAPAIALSALSLHRDEIMLVVPSDHLIKDLNRYEEAVERAKVLAERNYLVTFGITPTYPETGYGYIEADGVEVISFKEKPSIEKAKEYLHQGNYYWNSGMFCFKAGVFLDELKEYSPEVYERSVEAYENGKKDEIIRIKYEDMEMIEDISIDYALMEKSSKVKVIHGNMGWSDVGSFDALANELPNDKNGNLIIADKEVALIDVENLIIVDTDDALLISKKGSSQRVKDVVAGLKNIDSELVNIHNTVHRPWGTYTVLEDTSGYKIKKIMVKPNKRLSLQKHYHRSEHWIVVSGTATVTVGEHTQYVRPNESTYIKMGEIHRLSNEGKIPVVLIEAQVGEYTGEDDIVRMDDDFKRA